MMTVGSAVGAVCTCVNYDGLNRGPLCVVEADFVAVQLSSFLGPCSVVCT
jgi:hypothetical protein